MIPVRVARAEGPALDWMVAVALKEPIKFDPMGFGTESGGHWVWDDHGCGNPKTRFQRIGFSYSPSTKWEQGGPIIERAGIELKRGAVMPFVWAAFAFMNPRAHSAGPSPLVAAMRCFVISKLGDEIEVPDELLKEKAT